MIESTLNLYKQAYSGLSKRIWLLSIVMLINRAGSMVLAFMTLYCLSRGYSIEQGGLVVAIYGAGSVCGAFLGGKLSDKFGFYKVQFSALFLGGIMFMLLGQMWSYLSICVCAFVLALVNESFRPANSAAIAHYSTAENRTQSFALVRLAINLGFGVGIAVGGFLASINYHLLFWVDGGASVIAAVLLLIILPKVSLSQQLKPVEKSSEIENTLSPYRDKVFLRFLFFQLIFAICFFQLFTTIPIYFKTSLGMNEFWIGVVMSLNGVLIAIIEMVLVYKLEGRRSYLWYISIGSILMGASFLLLNLPLQNGLIVAFIAIFVMSFAEMISLPFMNSYSIVRSSLAKRGQYAGLYTMCWSLAQVIGSSTGGIFADRFGFFYLWTLVGSLCFITGIGFYYLFKSTTK